MEVHSVKITEKMISPFKGQMQRNLLSFLLTQILPLISTLNITNS